MNNRPMFNAYPDSMGGTLADIVNILEKYDLKNCFGSFYILPSIFNTDLDRGFSVVSYDLNRELATGEDLKKIEEMQMDLKLDFILNHASVLSKQFQDVIKKGEASEYRDFFINWNEFWEGHGKMTDEGYIEPDPKIIENMFFRKPGLPILMVRFPDGKNVPYWNTFYQEVKYRTLDAQDIMELTGLQYYSANRLAGILEKEMAEGKKLSDLSLGEYDVYKKEIVEYLESNRKYLGQMDLNIKSDKVWEFYEEVLKTLYEYGAKIVRLDAFAYASKEVGERNFFNEKGTWETLEKVDNIAKKYGLALLPEIHASYEEKRYEEIAEKGYMTYDFFLPGLLIDAMESKDGNLLRKWGQEIIEKDIKIVNMLGCHDGIPMLDLKGLIPEERIEELIRIILDRGGKVKNLHGQKNMYYQVNATYYSALGEDDRKMLMARALQLFMPGKPQVWYLDLFAGKNDYEAMKGGGSNLHREINRTNLSMAQIEGMIEKDVVKKQIDMLKFRNEFPAFSFDSQISIEGDGGIIDITWEKEGYAATLHCDLANLEFSILGKNPEGDVAYRL